jgi:hypothetical protein
MNITYERIAKIMQEDAAPSQVGHKTSVFINRMMMRLFSAPSLLSTLADVGIVSEGATNGGSTTIQLDFQRLPEEAIPVVISLIASPVPMRMLKYVKNGQARNGFEFKLSEADLPCDDYDMAN